MPVKQVRSEIGELFQFDYELMVHFILHAFLLHEIAQQESIKMCITLDGAELTKDLCHLTFGVKMTDPRAIDPRDGSNCDMQRVVFLEIFFRFKVETTAS